jgi:hypothetical protein
MKFDPFSRSLKGKGIEARRTCNLHLAVPKGNQPQGTPVAGFLFLAG